ncbi:MAG: M48 family metalloprotease [Acidithiobacillales bacterium]
MPEILLAHVVQSAAAAGALGGLLAAWGVRRPSLRLKFWLLALVLPAVLVPLFAALAPVRRSDPFRQHAALFLAARWTALPVGPWRLGPALAALLAAVGVGLYLRDLVPALRQGWRVGRHGPDGDPRGEEIGRRVAVQAARLGVAAPEARLVQDDEGAYLYCRGFQRPLILVSTGVLATLSPEELDAALAHEIGHVAGRHLMFGWGLIVLRSLLLFNPVAQILGRSAVLEMERAADDASTAATGRPEALASALAKLGVLSGDDGLAVPGGLRFHVLKGRLVRIAEGRQPAAREAREGLMLALAAGAIALLVFFVVA